MTEIDKECTEAIKVLVRVRPEDQREKDAVASTCVKLFSASNSLVCNNGEKVETFTFDHVVDEFTTQEEVFRTVGKNIAENCLRGYNGTIFAYGQTGSGKTFTMLGPDQTFTSEIRGIIPRTIEYLFAMMSREQRKNGIQYLCKCTFIEIYNENMYDLLETVPTLCFLREDIKKGVYVEGATEELISSPFDALQVLEKGTQNRRVGSTSMNAESSRSHSIFTIIVQSKTKNGELITVKQSKFNLVDLAGSERQKDTNATGQRLKEASNINKSLFSLTNVIHSLADISNGKPRNFIHYRDSKLTFLLKDSLGGNAKTVLIANISPSSLSHSETLSTLRFAQRVKMIQNKVVINEDNQGDVTALREEINRLKAEIIHYQKVNSVTTNIDETLLYGVLEKYKRMENEKLKLVEQHQMLQEVLEKRLKQLQSEKMILKLRDNTIVNLQKKLTPEFLKEFVSIENQSLKEEIKELRKTIENHPEVAKFAYENIVMKSQKQELEKIVYESSTGALHSRLLSLEDNAKDLTEQLVEYHQKNQSLIKQLSEGKGIDNEANSTKIQLLKENFEQMKEKYEAECIKNDILNKKEEELLMTIENTKERELEFESEIESSKKLITELEKSIEGIKINKELEIQRLNGIIEELKGNHEKATSCADALDSEISELRSEIIKLNQDLEWKEEENVKMKQKVAKLEHKARRMSDFASENRATKQAQLSAFTDRIDSLVQEKNHLNELIKEFTNQNELKDSEIQHIKEQLEEQQKVQLMFQKEKEELENEIYHFEQQFNKKEEEIDSLLKENHKLKDENISLQDELQYHTSRSVEDEKSILSLKNMNLQLENMAQQNVQRIQELEENLKNLISENQNGRCNLVEENSLLRDENQRHQRLLEERNEKIKSLDSEIIQHQKEFQQMEVSLSYEKNKILELNSRLKEMKEEKLDLKEKYDDICQQFEDIQKRNESILENLKDDHQKEKNSLLDSLSKKDVLLEELTLAQNNLKQALQSASDEVTQLHKELEQRVQNNFEIQKNLEALKLQDEKSKAYLKQLENKVSNFEKLDLGSQELTENNGLLLKKIEHLEKQIEKEQLENKKLREQLVQLSQITEGLEASRKEKNDQISSLKNDVQLLKDQNHKFQEASSFFENQTEKLEQLQTQLQGMKKKLQENESTVSELKKERDNLSNRLRQSEFNLENAQMDNEDLLARLNTLSELEENVNNEAREFETKYKELQEQIVRAEEEKKKIGVELEELRKENQKLIQHANTKQKLQYHVQIKKENNLLKEEVSNLKKKYEKFKAIEKENLDLTKGLPHREPLTTL